MKRRTRILQLAHSDERRELDFELDFLRSLTVAQRFRLMQQKTDELRHLLRQRGHSPMSPEPDALRHILLRRGH